MTDQYSIKHLKANDRTQLHKGRKIKIIHETLYYTIQWQHLTIIYCIVFDKSKVSFFHILLLVIFSSHYRLKHLRIFNLA